MRHGPGIMTRDAQQQQLAVSAVCITSRLRAELLDELEEVVHGALSQRLCKHLLACTHCGVRNGGAAAADDMSPVVEAVQTATLQAALQGTHHEEDKAVCRCPGAHPGPRQTRWRAGWAAGACKRCASSRAAPAPCAPSCAAAVGAAEAATLAAAVGRVPAARARARGRRPRRQERRRRRPARAGRCTVRRRSLSGCGRGSGSAPAASGGAQRALPGHGRLGGSRRRAALLVTCANTAKPAAKCRAALGHHLNFQCHMQQSFRAVSRCRQPRSVAITPNSVRTSRQPRWCTP